MNKSLDNVLPIGISLFLLAIVAGLYLLATRVRLYEIHCSKWISRLQKAVWVMGFFLRNSPGRAGLYF